MFFSLPLRSRFVEWQLQQVTNRRIRTHHSLHLNPIPSVIHREIVQSFTWYYLLRSPLETSTVCFYKLLLVPLIYSASRIPCTASCPSLWTDSLRASSTLHLLTVKPSAPKSVWCVWVLLLAKSTTLHFIAH